MKSISLTMWRGRTPRKCVSPAALYDIPIFAGVMAKVAAGVPTSRSQVMARSQEPPQTLPSTIPMTGTRVTADTMKKPFKRDVQVKGIITVQRDFAEIVTCRPDLCAGIGAEDDRAYLYRFALIQPLKDARHHFSTEAVYS